MTIAFFQGGRRSYLCEEKLSVSGISLSTESCDVAFLFFNVVLTVHEQVYFIDSCAFNVEGWVEFSGSSEGKVCC